MHAAVWAFQSQAVKSSEPAKSMSPRGCQSTHSMAPPGPSRLCLQLPAAVSQIPTCPVKQIDSINDRVVGIHTSGVHQALLSASNGHGGVGVVVERETYHLALLKPAECRLC